jgi:hypothetical protein
MFFYVSALLDPDTDTDPETPLNPDPIRILIRIWIRIHSTAKNVQFNKATKFALGFPAGLVNCTDVKIRKSHMLQQAIRMYSKIP